MKLREGFAEALRETRKQRQLTQEDFSNVSSRTYLSSLERGMKSPTLDKLEEIASVIGVHPVTLLAMTYCKVENVQAETFCKKIRLEVENFLTVRD
ncbi:XRE family transcriptional regulator [Herbaspirillum lusitanum]|uniref:helix-turn-helix domain-containing protein n=1 Tax=Herbaspirillum lusitanum TaxID=213312 RepID=UPI0022370F38|nr:helix-turn-helix transcriptional regulator [Herbaspirillum lusitanum]MCW5299414.1 XRE family transcriptional regulator [Herbaspirillum lusitanum]